MSGSASSSFLGVGHRRLAGLLAPVSCGGTPADDLGREELESGFARVALNTMLEPGDTDAGALIAALGPVEALTHIVSGADGAELLAHVGADASSARQRSRIADALSRWRAKGSVDAGVRALEMAAHVRARLLTPDAPGWPSGLDALSAGSPVVLWARGDPGRLGALDRSISLVGARAATGYGEHVAMEAAAGLGDRGFAIVSGGAYGIDGAAHRAALASDHVTIAFLAGGVDRLYPAGHSDLLRRIAADGLLIGELPCGSTPTRWRFLMRNRLIAAASGATVVIEAGRRSGSLNTAGHAAEIGRPLGAVPGPVTSPASAGCHRLIREYSATCVTTAAEMAELADPIGGGPGGSSCGRDQSDGDRALLAAMTSGGGHHPDDLARAVGLTTREVVASLGRLDVAGAVRLTETGWTATKR
jgi:DNA processing protein